MGIERLDVPADIKQFHGNRPVSQLMKIVWQSRKDLQEAFDLNTSSGQKAFISWYDSKQRLSRNSRWRKLASRLSRVSQMFPAAVRSKVLSLLAWVINMRNRHRPPSVHGRESIAQQPDCRQNESEVELYGGDIGINLIGYAHGELGLGEHVRMSAAALSTTDVAFGVVDFGAGNASRQHASLVSGKLIDSNKYRVNLFHITANQIVPAYLHLGREFFERRYNIGYPFWELSRFPQEWIPPLQLLDEVWAPTTYIQKTLSEALGKTVPHMPVGIVLPKIANLGRNYFGIPSDRYMFIFAFDSYSYIERKNPYAVVEAFRRAFPLRYEKAGLVLKSMNANRSSDSWKRLIREIDGDDRIQLINETMNKSELLSLKRECDCYISLHRAEGLGLGPMEAMLLGKPVIITNYSGNTDYAKPDNSCLVDYSLIPVQKDQYLCSEHQVWADPNVDQAAWYMRKLASDPDFGAALGNRAAAYVANNFSLSHCGQIYKRRLQEIGLI